MPQLSLLDAGGAGSTFLVEYRSDPLAPESPAHLTVTVKNAKNETVGAWFARVPHEVLYELVAEVARECWEAWLFGTMQDAQHAFNRTVAYWRQEAKDRAVGLELAREAVRSRPQ